MPTVLDPPGSVRAYELHRLVPSTISPGVDGHDTPAMPRSGHRVRGNLPRRPVDLAITSLRLQEMPLHHALEPINIEVTFGPQSDSPGSRNVTRTVIPE